MPPDDPMLCRISGIACELGRPNDCIGTAVAAEMRPGTVKVQKSDGVTMKNTDETPHVMVPVMERWEEERKRCGMSPLPRTFDQNRPSAPVNVPALLKVPSPAPAVTAFKETETELYLPKVGRRALSGERRQHHSAHRALKQDLTNMHDETCVIGAAGVILGRRENGETLLKQAEFDNVVIPATLFAPNIG